MARINRITGKPVMVLRGGKKALARLNARAKPTIGKRFAKMVLAVVNRKEETKYAARDFGAQVATDTLVIPSSLQFACPKVSQGIGSNQRIGQKIAQAHGRVDFQFYFVPTSVPPAPGNAPTQDIYVKIFKVNSKIVKSYPQMTSLSANTLLDVGNQTSCDWNVTQPTQACAQMPLSHEDFSGLVHTMRLTKNQGFPNNDNTGTNSPNTFGHPANRYSYSWKHKGNLLYDDTNSDFPTNYAPCFMIVVMNTDGTPVIPPGGGNNPVQYYTRSHIWYKDV